MYLQFLIFPIVVSPVGNALGVGFLALQAAIDFLLDFPLREFLPALGADFRNALWRFHFLRIGLNRRVVSVHCHVLPVARPGLLGGYGAQGDIVRFLAHGSHSFISRHSSMASLTIIRIPHVSPVAISTQKSRNTITANTVAITSAILCAPFLRQFWKRHPVGDMSAGFKSVRVKIRCTVHIRFPRAACDVLVLIKRQHRDTYLRQPLTARNPPSPLQRLHAHPAGFVHWVYTFVMLPVFRVQNFNCSVNRHFRPPFPAI